MMKKIALIVFALLLMVTSVAALPMTIDEVEIDGVTIDPDQTNRLDILRDDEFEVRITFTVLQDLDDVEFEIAIFGYEYNDVERIVGHIPNADYDANITYVKRVHLSLPDEVDEDDYKLRIIVADRYSNVLIRNYNLKIDVERHKLKIEDVLLFPSSHIEAGRALLATVRVENKGERTEDDVRVEVSIPELGISGADYIDEIDPNDEEETEEIFMPVPVCAQSGTYLLEVLVSYDEDSEYERTTIPIQVIASDRCVEEEEEGSIVVVIAEAPNTALVVAEPEPVEQKTSAMKIVRRMLEVSLLVLIGVLAVIGLIIGFSKMGKTNF